MNAPAGPVAPTGNGPASIDEAANMRSLLTRVAGDPNALAPAIRRVVAELDSNLPISDLRSVDEIRLQSLRQPLRSRVPFGLVAQEAGEIVHDRDRARGRTRHDVVSLDSLQD